MDTPLIGEDKKQIEKSLGGSLNHWVGGLIHIPVQNRYVIQYLIMRLSGYMNAPTGPVFLEIRHGIEYLMHHPYEPMIYSRKKN